MSFSRAKRLDGLKKDGRHHKGDGLGFGGMRFGGRRDGKVASWAQIMNDDSVRPMDQDYPRQRQPEDEDDCEEKVCVNKPLKQQTSSNGLVRFIPYKKSKKHTVPKIKNSQFQDLMAAVLAELNTQNPRATKWSDLTPTEKGKVLKNLLDFKKASLKYGFATDTEWQQVEEELGIKQKAVKGEETTDYTDMKAAVMEAIQRYAAKPDEHGQLRRVSLDDLQYKKFINKYLKEVKKYYLQDVRINERDIGADTVNIFSVEAGVGRVSIAAKAANGTVGTTAGVPFFKGKGLYSFYAEGNAKGLDRNVLKFDKAALGVASTPVADQAKAAGYNATAAGKKFPELEYFELNRDVIGRKFLADDDKANALTKQSTVEKTGNWATTPQLSVFTFITEDDNDGNLSALKDLIESMYDLFITQTEKFLRDEKNADRNEKWTDGKHGMKSAHTAAARRSGRIAARMMKSGKAAHHKSGKVAHQKSRGRGRPKSHKRR